MKKRMEGTSVLVPTAHALSPPHFFFLLSSTTSYPFIDQQYISAHLIQVDVSVEWCSFERKPFQSHIPPPTCSRSLSFTQWALMAMSIPSGHKYQHNEKHVHTFTTCLLTEIVVLLCCLKLILAIFIEVLVLINITLTGCLTATTLAVLFVQNYIN